MYKLFDIRDPPRNSSTGRLLNPFDIYREIRKDGMDELEKRKTCGQDKYTDGKLRLSDLFYIIFRSYAGFFLENLAKRKMDPKLLNFWSVLDLIGSFSGSSMLHFASKGSLLK